MNKRRCELCGSALIYGDEMVGGMAFAFHLIEEHPDEWEESWREDIHNMWKRSERILGEDGGE